MDNTPEEIVVAPVYVLIPLRVSVPAPVLVRPRPPVVPLVRREASGALSLSAFPNIKVVASGKYVVKS